MIEIYIYKRLPEMAFDWISDDDELLGISEQFIAQMMGWA